MSLYGGVYNNVTLNDTEYGGTPDPSSAPEPSSAPDLYGAMYGSQNHTHGHRQYHTHGHKRPQNSGLMCTCAFLTCVIVVLIFLIAVKGNSMRDNLTSKGNKIMYFNRPGCGHCTKFTPVWVKFVEKAKADSTLDFTYHNIDCSDPNNSALCITERANGLTGVPHIVKVMADGTRTIFSEARIVNALMAFAKA